LLLYTLLMDIMLPLRWLAGHGLRVKDAFFDRVCIGIFLKAAGRNSQIKHPNTRLQLP
jgi:hypothetical protein